MIILFAGSLFLVAGALHLYVRIRLRPPPDSDFDQYYHEFEDRHPVYARYSRWSAITFAAVVVAVLLLFLAAYI